MESSDWLLAAPGIIGLLATIIKIISDWRKGKAEAAELIVGSAAEVVVLLREELADAKVEIAKLRGRVRRLETQVRSLGAVPVNESGG